jgi:hypothetical protein
MINNQFYLMFILSVLIMITKSLLNRKQVIRINSIFHRHHSLLEEDDPDMWNHGEVVWDFPKNPNPVGDDKKNPTKFTPQSKNIQHPQQTKMPTPLLKKLDTDQTNMASLSAILKTTQTEFNQPEMLLYNIQTMTESINNHFIFTPMEIYIFAYLSGIYFVYNKVKYMESIRIDRLYRADSRTIYYKKYEKMRRMTMVAFIFLSVIFTRNVHNVI